MCQVTLSHLWRSIIPYLMSKLFEKNKGNLLQKKHQQQTFKSRDFVKISAVETWDFKAVSRTLRLKHKACEPTLIGPQWKVLQQQILHCDSSLLFGWFVTFLSKSLLLPRLPQQLSPACLSAYLVTSCCCLGFFFHHPPLLLRLCIYLFDCAVLVIYKPVMHHPLAMKDNYRPKGAMGLIFQIKWNLIILA